MYEFLNVCHILVKLSFEKYLILLNSHFINFTFRILWIPGRVLDRLQCADILKSEFCKSPHAHNPHCNDHPLSQGPSSVSLAL